MTLPDIIDFDESDFPHLASIFRAIEAGIAAVLAEELALRKRSVSRRMPARGTAPRTRRPQPRKKVAA